MSIYSTIPSYSAGPFVCFLPDDASDNTRQLMAAIESQGLQVTARLVDAGDAKNGNKWTVTLTANGKTLYSTEYNQGAAHRVERMSRSEKWRSTPFQFGRPDPKREARVNHYAYRSQPAPPCPVSVLYSLVMDAQSGMDNFADFCANLGYDEDSRQAEATWRACCDTFRALGYNCVTEWADRFSEANY